MSFLYFIDKSQHFVGKQRHVVGKSSKVDISCTEMQKKKKMISNFAILGFQAFKIEPSKIKEGGGLF